MSILRSTAALSLWGLLVASAAADVVAHPEGAPSFTPVEMHIVASDARLRTALEDEPWHLRKAFDLFAAGDAADTSDASNPRSSPEAALDLLQIIKQAGGGTAE